MIGTEFLEGQGLGNQLFCYVTARCMALRKGCEFGTANQAQAGNVFHSNRGMYFMDIDLGREITDEEKAAYRRIDEKNDRLYVGTSVHDMTYGCDVSAADDALFEVFDNTLIYGVMQDEKYFGEYRDEVREWLKVREEADSYEYTADDLCIINMRGGEYTNHPDLFLDRNYWLKAMERMRKINPDMRFMIVTEDVEAARKVLPEVSAHHFDMGKDYVTVKNARYIILSNSSFAVLPVFTSETIRYAIAPKYWARHNVSDGYWSTEQNIYSFLNYMDREGRMFTADECREELKRYKETSALYKRVNVRPGALRKACQVVRRKGIYGAFFAKRVWRSIARRVRETQGIKEG